VQLTKNTKNRQNVKFQDEQEESNESESCSSEDEESFSEIDSSGSSDYNINRPKTLQQKLIQRKKMEVNKTKKQLEIMQK